MAWFWRMHELPSWMPVIPHIPILLVQYFYRGLTAVIAIFVVFSMAHNYMNGINVINNWCREVGSISLGIYVVHIILIYYIIRLANIVIPDSLHLIDITFIFIVDLALSVIIVRLLNKNKWTSRLLLGKV